jgi:hypothetical protein
MFPSIIKANSRLTIEGNWKMKGLKSLWHGFCFPFAMIANALMLFFMGTDGVSQTDRIGEDRRDKE